MSVVKKVHSAYAERATSRPSSSTAVRRPTPAPNHAGSMWRDCVHENTHGTARSASNPSLPGRTAGREPICMRAMTSIGVTASNHV